MYLFTIQCGIVGCGCLVGELNGVIMFRIFSVLQRGAIPPVPLLVDDYHCVCPFAPLCRANTTGYGRVNGWWGYVTVLQRGANSFGVACFGSLLLCGLLRESAGEIRTVPSQVSFWLVMCCNGGVGSRFRCTMFSQRMTYGNPTEIKPFQV